MLPLGVCLSAGLTVVASESAETKELIQDNVNAIVDPSTNPRCVAQRAYELQDDPSALQRLSQAAQATGRSRFSVARFADDWRRIYALADGSETSKAMVSRAMA
jgi:glycosyltransferase involved in cell wall biosynthesis